ncbi:MAG TPA: chromosomal replication initiator protein DnaA [Clostridia bacterium]|nr:chromosomal replication initiator protein DnaA [Clostridia bacterium]
MARRSADSIWNSVCQQTLSRQVNPLTYNTWFVNAKPYLQGEREFGLSVPNEFALEYIVQHRDMIEQALKDATRVHYSLEVVVRADGTIPAKEEPKRPAAPTMYKGNGYGDGSFQVGHLNPDYSFSTFIVGSGNSFAHAASVAVASMESPTNYNPLFLYGGSGLGKTHLMHAIGNQVRRDFPDKRVVYIQSEQFVNEFIACIQKNDFESFRNHYRLADMLLIDDIQFIESKERMQVEFFYTFNALYESGKNIVLTCDKPPQSLASLADRLRTRFISGLTIDITPPDYETRIAILNNLCKSHGFDIAYDIIEYIANNITSNVREIEGAFKTVSALQMMQSEVTLDTARQALQSVIQPGAVKTLDFPLIMEIVAHYYGVTVDDLKSRQRSQVIVEPRQIAMYLCRTNLNKTLKEIGAAFGGKNHATVLHACAKITEEMASDPTLSETVSSLQTRLQ